MPFLRVSVAIIRGLCYCYSMVRKINNQNDKLLRVSCFFLTVMLSITPAVAQSAKPLDSLPQTPPRRIHVLYEEFLGNGLTLSTNYDFRFTKSDKDFGMRVGIGLIGAGDIGLLSIPVAVNHLAGRAPHYFESSLGYTFVTAVSTQRYYESFSGGAIIPGVGYRYQSLRKRGFFARIVFSPLINPHPGGGWFPFGGIAFGQRL